MSTALLPSILPPGLPPPAAGSHQESPSCQTYAEYLKLVYSRTHENKWPNNPISSYVNLASVLKPLRMSRDTADAFTRATLHHGIDEIAAEKKPIAMEDVLKPLESQTKVNCVLVEGPPGVGKSTFAWELCQRWDSIPDLKKFSQVVLLRFRDKWVQEAKDIADLFYHPDPSIQQAVAEELCSRNGEGLCLILDGFDEFPASLRKRSLLLDIIKGSRLPGCTVVITSRPSATADLTSCRVDKRIEVLGFTQKEIEEYASIFFDSEPQLLDGFHQYRKLNPAIKSMMYIPLNTTIVAEVFLTSRGKPLSHTMTELYVEMAFSILIRFLKEIGQDKLVDQILQLTKLQDLPSDILSHFLKLGEMAFKGTIKEEVIFNEFPNDYKHFGFLNASPELYARRPALSYNFLHKSIQELFTAFHISQLPPSEQKEMFLKQKVDTEDGRFKEVWRFVAGLTGFKAIGWEEVKSKCYPRDLVSYLYEAQDIAACDSVLGEIDDGFAAECLFDCYAAGWCIAASECRLKLWFNTMETEAEVCEAFSSGVKSRQEVRGSVAEFNLSLNAIKEEDVVHLMDLPSSIWHKTTELRVYQCGVDASAMGRVAEFVLIHMVSLKHLDIRSNNLGEGDLENIFNTLSKHECLETLHIGGHPIGCADVEALARLIRPDSGRLKELDIRDMPKMSPECQRMLMETLLQPSSLDRLGMCNVPIKEEDVVHLMELPSSIWHKTTELSVYQCGVDASAMGRVAEFVLIRMVSLKHLDIRSNNLGEGDLENIFNTLSKHECLETLYIGGHPIGCADVEALARLIRPDSGRLKALHIHGVPEMSPDCQKMLMETLFQPSSLESLEMRRLDVSSALDSLALALLADNTNLTSMDIDFVGPALSSILEVLKDNESVKTLNINYLGNADNAGAVASVLTANKYLDTLKINSTIFMGDYSDDKRRKARFLTVINALQNNKSLKKLKVSAFSSVGDADLFTQTEKDAMDPRVVFAP